jgi:hypothetical protein
MYTQTNMNTAMDKDINVDVEIAMIYVHVLPQ